MHITADDLIAALRQAGLRATAPRRAVCEVIARHHGEHLTAAAIVERVDVDQATVYRTLDSLERAGVLTHTHLGHGPSVYHLADDPPHHHIVCSRCGATVEVSPGDLRSVDDRVGESTGFLVEPGHFALSGLCPDCR
ncbi:MAG TPA: Fur family transcriptional regulator [Acidimicrobiia bacterium]|nr:Fur family transcriptional regulator [Acidimicrobiia bacterium]